MKEHSFINLGTDLVIFVGGVSLLFAVVAFLVDFYEKLINSALL